MPSIGPQLPPHLQNRKRSHAEADDNSSSDSSTGPALPSRPEKETSPAFPKRTRVVGPAPPPAPLDERPPLDPPANDDDESESDDDGDFGPSLPSASDSVARSSIASVKTHVSAPASATKRDEWMTIAPTNGDWSSRVDPTKLKNRKFNTGKGAKAPPRAGASGDASWHETPEQKQERLKREVLGMKDASESSATSRPGAAPNAQDDATARRLKEYKDTQRGPSLYANHTATQDKPVDDDPSARAFDREKDIGSGSTINATKRREMVKKATDFTSRFETARYL